MASSPRIRTLQIIWAAMVAGVVIYTAVVAVVMRTGSTPSASLDPSIMNLIGAGVLAYMVGGVFARRTMVERIPRDAAPEARMGAYQTAVIVGLALSESGGLILVTMGMLTGAPTWVLAGGGAAAILMFMARPTGEEIGAD